jgi:hypothetical protein
MLDPNRSRALYLSPAGLTFIIAGHQVEIELTVDELRHMAVAFAAAADRREGKELPSEAKAILGEVEGSA